MDTHIIASASTTNEEKENMEITNVSDSALPDNCSDVSSDTTFTSTSSCPKKLALKYDAVFPKTEETEYDTYHWMFELGEQRKNTKRDSLDYSSDEETESAKEEIAEPRDCEAINSDMLCSNSTDSDCSLGEQSNNTTLDSLGYISELETESVKDEMAELRDCEENIADSKKEDESSHSDKIQVNSYVEMDPKCQELNSDMLCSNYTDSDCALGEQSNYRNLDSLGCSSKEETGRVKEVMAEPRDSEGNIRDSKKEDGSSDSEKIKVNSNVEIDPDSPAINSNMSCSKHTASDCSLSEQRKNTRDGDEVLDLCVESITAKVEQMRMRVRSDAIGEQSARNYSGDTVDEETKN